MTHLGSSHLSIPLQTILDHFQVTPTYFSLVEDVMDLVKSLIKEHFPNENVLPFGSFATECLFTPDSDLDLCIIGQHSSQSAIKALRKVESSLDLYFSNISIVPATVCPIIKFTDPHSNLQVDLSIGDDKGPVAAQFLKEYLSMSRHAINLCKLVKRWAADHELAGAFEGGFTSYCLVLMVIHYLSYKLPSPILPPVSEIVGNSSITAVIKSKRMASFSKQWNKQRRKPNLTQLLYGFFNFYLHFDFINFAISILHEWPIPIKSLPKKVKTSTQGLVVLDPMLSQSQKSPALNTARCFKKRNLLLDELTKALNIIDGRLSGNLFSIDDVGSNTNRKNSKSDQEDSDSDLLCESSVCYTNEGIVYLSSSSPKDYFVSLMEGHSTDEMIEIVRNNKFFNSFSDYSRFVCELLEHFFTQPNWKHLVHVFSRFLTVSTSQNLFSLSSLYAGCKTFVIEMYATKEGVVESPRSESEIEQSCSCGVISSCHLCHQKFVKFLKEFFNVSPITFLDFSDMLSSIPARQRQYFAKNLLNNSASLLPRSNDVREFYFHKLHHLAVDIVGRLSTTKTKILRKSITTSLISETSSMRCLFISEVLDLLFVQNVSQSTISQAIGLIESLVNCCIVSIKDIRFALKIFTQQKIMKSNTLNVEGMNISETSCDCNVLVSCLSCSNSLVKFLKCFENASFFYNAEIIEILKNGPVKKSKNLLYLAFTDSTEVEPSNSSNNLHQHAKKEQKKNKKKNKKGSEIIDGSSTSINQLLLQMSPQPSNSFNNSHQDAKKDKNKNKKKNKKGSEVANNPASNHQLSLQQLARVAISSLITQKPQEIRKTIQEADILKSNTHKNDFVFQMFTSLFQAYYPGLSIQNFGKLLSSLCGVELLDFANLESGFQKFCITSCQKSSENQVANENCRCGCLSCCNYCFIRFIHFVRTIIVSTLINNNSFGTVLGRIPNSMKGKLSSGVFNGELPTTRSVESTDTLDSIANEIIQMLSQYSAGKLRNIIEQKRLLPPPSERKSLLFKIFTGLFSMTCNQTLTLRFCGVLNSFLAKELVSINDIINAFLSTIQFFLSLNSMQSAETEECGCGCVKECSFCCKRFASFVNFVLNSLPLIKPGLSNGIKELSNGLEIIDFFETNGMSKYIRNC
ncbi:hypothetical protein P9112_008668 [Eukaryota sp. TZLM1-RC]